MSEMSFTNLAIIGVIKAQSALGGNLNPQGVPTGVGDLENTIKTVFTVAYSISGVATLGYLIWGGYQIIMSSGDPQKFEMAIDTVKNAMIGFVLIVCSALIFQFVAKKLGADGVFLNLNIPII